MSCYWEKRSPVPYFSPLGPHLPHDYYHHKARLPISLLISIIRICPYDYKIVINVEASPPISSSRIHEIIDNLGVRLDSKIIDCGCRSGAFVCKAVLCNWSSSGVWWAFLVELPGWYNLINTRISRCCNCGPQLVLPSECRCFRRRFIDMSGNQFLYSVLK